MSAIQAMSDIAPAVKYQPKPKRYYSMSPSVRSLSGEDTGGAYCLLDLRVAPGLGCLVIHTRVRMRLLCPLRRKPPACVQNVFELAARTGFSSGLLQWCD